MKGNIIALVIVLALFVAVNAQTNSYCNFRNCNHTLCIYPNAGQSDKCVDPQGNGLTENEKQRIVTTHNSYRQKVASGQETLGNPGPQPAGKIGNLKWNNELATIAQRWAEQCTFQSDQCRRTAKYPWVNQNLAVRGTTGDVNNIQIESLVQSWIDTAAYFDSNTVSNYTYNSKAATYSQVVWGETTMIGCGATKYRGGIFNRYYLVCNYAPGGNNEGERVYQTIN